ncbi:MAG: transporter substrate-binding domain-containing protein [Hylemonella sp.]|uniref:transporter substrate-binding domain-containing protein n=1 Tax=Hylemonella sp. TaxID=2066020 RepID=UPI0022CCCB69|nr:transporter substrate-binding domain-containing protein [Hylemonella sp.]MCZ8251324.1 transporter substrate-binding domain-containing protein [Hylemonella sp.]
MALDAQLVQELIPSGTLRVGVAYAPRPTPIFVAQAADGDYQGVAVDLGRALAQRLGVPLEIVAAATTAELTRACLAGEIDLGFMPADEERRRQLDFSPPYFIIESTYLAAGQAGIATQADVDRLGVTVVGIAGSTTIRAAGRSLTRATVVAAPSIDAAMALMKSGQAQVFALTHDALPPLQRELPGSVILAGAFQVTGVAMAVRQHRPAALACLTRFIEEAKASGLLRQAFDAAGLGRLDVAP